ncbi:MAG: hypothetical protein WCP85_29260 [Mariniphaga sp.]
MYNSILNYQRKIIGETFGKYGATPMGTYQNNTATQYLRFDRLILNIKEIIKGGTIHDVGTGICDLHKYLISKNINHLYSGTEIVQAMIDFSINKYPGIELYNRDLLTVNNESYDFLLLSGTLNNVHELDKNIWEEYAYNLIEKMFSLCNKGIAFNFLTSNNTFSQDDLIYFDPGKVLNFCINKLSRFVVVDNSYPLYEVTITVFKKEFIKELYSDENFAKYFKN